jgi:HTH-type transcriptional regulator/antitoxin HigA
MVIGLIKNETEYQQALDRIEELLAEPANNEETERELELLGHLVDKYESEQFPIEYPDPVKAIKNRMEDLGLRQKDLTPIVGSSSKVSEVLNYKRRLSLPMMRALNKHLKIPPEVLLQEDPETLPEEEPEIDWQKFHVQEIVHRGWVQIGTHIKDHAEEIVRYLYSLAGQRTPNSQGAMLRQGGYGGRRADPYALQTWLLMVMAKANYFDQYCSQTVADYDPEHITQDLLSNLARLSVHGEQAPLLARDYLAQLGIKLIFEKHLRHTYLDGACLLMEDGTPVIGLTMRHDRIDAFWFTLMHEIAHLKLHISQEQRFIIDEDIQNNVEDKEKEASAYAAQIFIPDHVWNEHPARVSGRKRDILDLADKLELHPAIIAGRVRYERNNFKILHNLVGHGVMRSHCERQGVFDPVECSPTLSVN